MGLYKHILVTTDFSATSLVALPVARELADACGAKLTCLNVVPIPDPAWIGIAAYGSPAVESRLLEGAQEQMAKLVEEHLPKGATGAVEQGPVAEVVASYVEKHGIDLIVIGSHGHTGFKRFLLGSVAERVIRRAPCSTLVIKGEAIEKASEAEK